MSYPAAFRRLCVETWASVGEELGKYQPPSGGCVLKHLRRPKTLISIFPAAFRRLCVETVLAPLLL